MSFIHKESQALHQNISTSYVLTGFMIYPNPLTIRSWNSRGQIETNEPQEADTVIAGTEGRKS